MDFFEFYKELYHKENDRRQEVINALNIPIAVATALSTGAYFLVTSFEYQQVGANKWLFIIAIGLGGLALLISIYYLVRAFIAFKKGYEYTGIPYPQELYNWHKSLETHYNQYPTTLTNANIEFKNYLIKNMVKHIDHNMYVNDQKHRFIHNSKWFLVAALILMIISSTFFSYNHFQKAEVIYKLKMSNDSLFSITLYPNKNDETYSTMSDDKKPQPAPPPPPPPPPTDRTIKEGQEPPKPKGDGR